MHRLFTILKNTFVYDNILIIKYRKCIGKKVLVSFTLTQNILPSLIITTIAVDPAISSFKSLSGEKMNNKIIIY